MSSVACWKNWGSLWPAWQAADCSRAVEQHSKMPFLPAFNQNHFVFILAIFQINDDYLIWPFIWFQINGDVSSRSTEATEDPVVHHRQTRAASRLAAVSASEGEKDEEEDQHLDPRSYLSSKRGWQVRCKLQMHCIKIDRCDNFVHTLPVVYQI